MRAIAFEPYINNDSKILILGSFPSIKSREEGFYYGNTRNRFWQILATATNSAMPITIEEKKILLKANKIAVYDTVDSCEIVGSLDSNIRDNVASDITDLVKQSAIEVILLNGAVASRIFHKHNSEIPIESISLPSTSPANTKLDTRIWIETIKKYL